MRRAILGVWALAALTTAVRAQPIVAAFERFYRADANADAAAGGRLLLNELNCVACHEPPAAWREHVPGRGKISLRGVGSRMSVDALRAFVHAPHGVKPGTTMPEVVRAEPEAADAIAAYLASLRAEMKAFPAGDAEHGRRLFESVGCVACHAPEGGIASRASAPIAVARHYAPDALVAFLLDPLHTRPAGRMPATELSEREAADLAAYLQAGHPASAQRAAEPARIEPAAVARGRAEFAARNCAACHDTADTEPLAPVRAKPLREVDAERGCLAATPPPTAPDFALDDAQRAALRGAVRTLQASREPERLSAAQRVAETFQRLNCYACHEWRGRGGVEPSRTPFFTSTDAAESLGEIGRLPPALDQAGRKLTTAWLEKLLWGKGGGVRPYLSARMPACGEQAAGELVPLLEEACRPETPLTIDVSGAKGHQRFATGRTLLGTGTGGLGCVACHGVKSREPAGVRAINLTHTAQRLRPEYFKALLLDPQGLQPGTIMPPLFAGRRHADKEIESLWTYFKELDQSDVLPEGLAVAGTFELKPAEEGRPIVFRTFLEHAGTQAISVGYPEGVHVAFDAFEVRWALAWRGRFLDAQSNWEERPMKPVKALGEPRTVLPPTMPLAKLGRADGAWPETFGAAAGYAFKGYRLAADGTPTFRYAVGGIEVEDTMRPAAGGTLRRTVVLRGGGDGWYFLGAARDARPERVAWRNGEAVFEEEIQW